MQDTNHIARARVQRTPQGSDSEAICDLSAGARVNRSAVADVCTAVGTHIDERVRRGPAERAEAVRPTRSEWSVAWPTLRSIADRVRRRRRRIVAVAVAAVGGIAGAIAAIVAVL